MKKLLALVLALVMVLGLGVTAFAVDLNVIVLEEDDDEEDDKDTVKALPEAPEDSDYEDVYLVPADGGDFYFMVDDTGIKNIAVSATGSVTAEIVKFDPKTMKYDNELNIKWAIKYKEDGENVYVSDAAPANYEEDEDYDDPFQDYDYVKEGASEWSKNEDDRAHSYTIVAYTDDTADEEHELDGKLVKVTVAENYTAAYKEGTVKVTGKEGKTTKVAELTIISDVAIFEYNYFKGCVDDGDALVIGTNGYSDYITAELGYSKVFGDDYDALKLRGYEATVVSTTEFLYAKGEELIVATAEDNAVITVTIDEVAKGQKGVNFAYDDFSLYDEDDDEAGKGDVAYIDFGFLGNQVINSDFEIDVNLPWTAYQLRELFGKKLEEEDVITYYVLKDGVKIDEFVVDYANDEIDEPVELEIIGKAGDKLGYYTITLDAPAAEEGGEENPNTGAESVVGVVAAMAVISLVSAAAVSLKK